jgi:glycolate oxidase iron-sulfur subunit
MSDTPEIFSRESTGLATQSALTQINAPHKPSAFDALNPPEPAVMDKCVHCGFCLPACPTYVLWGDEMDSPRGRIWLMRKAALGEAPLDNIFQTHIDNCLGCMACMTACPSGVEYNKLIEDTRGQVERAAEHNGTRPLSDRLFRKLLFATFPHPRRLRVLGLPLAIYQRSGLQRLVRATGLLKLLPERMSAMESLLPPVPLNPFHSLPRSLAARTTKRGRVGMLTGCVQDAYFAHVNAATARVLAAEGFDVIIPRAQGCCGALMVHSGLDAQATEYAKRMIATFESENLDAIVINAAGCGSTMKEYPHLLRNDPAWSARGVAFSAKCKDISEILAGFESTTPRSPLPLRVAYHDACHLRHAQNIWQQPRALLAQIPQLTVEEIAEATLCCGSAGVYNLLNPEPANELGDRKVAHLLATNAQAVVSANPGCLLQLMNGLRRRRAAELPTFHMVELLDASIRGLSVDQLLHGRRSLDVTVANPDVAPPHQAN